MGTCIRLSLVTSGVNGHHIARDIGLLSLPLIRLYRARTAYAGSWIFFTVGKRKLI